MKKIRRNDLPASSLPEDRAQAAQLTSDIRSELARVADAQSALQPVVLDLYDEMIRSRQSFENTSGETIAASRELVTVTTTLAQAAERLTAAVRGLTARMDPGFRRGDGGGGGDDGGRGDGGGGSDDGGQGDGGGDEGRGSATDA